MTRFARAVSLSALLSAALFGAAAFAYTSPGKPTGFVNDFAHILTAEQESALEFKLAEYSRPAGVQIAVATVPSLGGDTIENYAAKLFQEWGIGSKIKDNGLLLLVAQNDREVRIEVGYGLEPTVTDAMASTIIRTILAPAFKSGDYYGGIDRALTSIMGLIDHDPETMQAVQDAAQPADSHSSFPYQFIFLGLVVVLNLLGFMARTKSWWLGGVIGLAFGFFFGGLIGAIVCAVIGLAVDFVLSKFGGSWFNGPRGPRGPLGPGGIWFLGGRGPGSGSGFGSGFGGFGGGSSGGGGASGKW